MKKLYYLIMLTVILGLVLTGCTLLSNVGQVPTTEQSGINYLTKGTETDPEPFPLYAGQDILVGEVLVWSDDTQVCVKYELSENALDEGWLLYETHLEAATSLAGIPQENGNPPPGKFRYGDDELGGVEEAGLYCIDFEDIIGFIEGEDLYGTDIFIAAHAVIEKTECELLMEAPYGAYTVTEYTQGLRKDTTAVLEDRSDPNAVLTWDTNKFEEDFFSLGFGGEIIVEFDCCIANREGPDVLVVEDTWGSYKLEKADVYASVDSIEWVYLGEADNVTRNTTYSWQTVSQFDLGDLECAKYIKIVDTTDSGPLPSNADGYDLNTIQALQDCLECTTYSETAWGAVSEGFEPFPGKNWATYFTYTVPLHQIEVIAVSSDPVEIELTSGDYRFVVSGTADAGDTIDFDAKYSITNRIQGDTWTDAISGYTLPPEVLDLFVNDASVNWGGYNEKHIYEYLLAGWTGGAVTFCIYDTYPINNSGYLTVEIYKQ